jgi:glycosyltransferase involved in cell wall biosynthesis
MDKRPHILFLTRSLARGGAERQLALLAEGLHSRGWRVEVCCLYSGGVFRRDLERAGVPVIDLAKRGRWDLFGFLWRLWRLIRQRRPDIVHGYLPVPNMLSLMARLLMPGTRVVWGVRASIIDLAHYDWLSRLTFWLQCRLSPMATLIIANSTAGLEYHAQHGFPRDKMKVVPNGIDTSHFGFDPVGRERMRRTWNVPHSAKLIGLIGRLDPMKDHSNFLCAAARLASDDSEWWFVCVGDGSISYREELALKAARLGLTRRLIWAGPCDDMVAAYSALDIAVSSSKGEGFPNVVAEAMSCGKPCVVTDVGDSAMVVGETGWVVPPEDSAALAEGIERLYSRLSNDGGAIAVQVRARVIGCFGRQALIDATANIVATHGEHRVDLEGRVEELKQ